MKRMVATTLGAFALASLVWRLATYWLSQGWAEALGLASAGLTMAFISSVGIWRRQQARRSATQPSAVPAQDQRATA
jgi:hypothetical protein